MKRTVILMIAAAFAAGCFQSRTIEPGPAETIEAFYHSLCAGDFSEAACLCDSLSMNGYIDGFRKAWEAADSTISVMASDILSEMDLVVTYIEKNGQSRTIFYKLTSQDGQSKEKVATLRKEERAWKVEGITDRH